PPPLPAPPTPPPRADRPGFRPPRRLPATATTPIEAESYLSPFRNHTAGGPACRRHDAIGQGAGRPIRALDGSEGYCGIDCGGLCAGGTRSDSHARCECPVFWEGEAPAEPR